MFDSVDQSNNLNEAKRLNDSNGLNAKLNEVLGNERVAEEMRRRVSVAATSKDSQVIKA